MKVLVACEESQAVCKAFRDRGFEAYSCDIQQNSDGFLGDWQWHIEGDALAVVNGGGFCTMDSKHHYVKQWDLVIAHPPCTYLTKASAVRLFASDGTVKDRARFREGIKARCLFELLLNSDARFVAVENPVPLSIFGLPKYTQIIEPYLFGDPWRKKTCLWLNGLPPLEPTNIVEPKGLWVGSTSKRKAGKVYSSYSLKSCRDQKTRSKTFPGIAEAMADQWGDFLMRMKEEE